MLNDILKQLTARAKKSSRQLINLSTDKKNAALLKMAESLLEQERYILQENAKDVAAGKKSGMVESLIDRLTLNERRIRSMADSLRQIAQLEDPVYQTIEGYLRPNGMYIQKRRVPIGVILIVYEARPNVTSDCVGLCFKSGNAAILRGGSNALNSNRAIFNLLQEACASEGVKEAFFFIDSADKEAVDILVRDCASNIDLVIPRGGQSLIEKIVSISRVPVIKHYKGVCHIYVDKELPDREQALSICLNAKVQRPAVCNAMETLLVHEQIAGDFLPRFKKAADAHAVELRGCARTRQILKGVKAAAEDDWYAEYLDLILAVRVVDSVEQAIEHINTYGSGHTESILSSNTFTIEKFLKEVDSACVFSNISTRFSDGYEFGLGAEIGISTDKLHARGPMGLRDLTTYKYIVTGNGQIRE